MAATTQTTDPAPEPDAQSEFGSGSLWTVAWNLRHVPVLCPLMLFFRHDPPVLDKVPDAGYYLAWVMYVLLTPTVAYLCAPTLYAQRWADAFDAIPRAKWAALGASWLLQLLADWMCFAVVTAVAWFAVVEAAVRQLPEHLLNEWDDPAPLLHRFLVVVRTSSGLDLFIWALIATGLTFKWAPVPPVFQLIRQGRWPEKLKLQ